MIPLSRRRRESPLPDVTPLLDVVFILLIFFVIAAAFAIHGIDMRLPRVSTARTYAGNPLEIVLSADGSLSHNKEPITALDLTYLVRRAAEGNGAARQILLIPDRDASVDAFLHTVTLIRDSGGEHLVIAAEPAARPESKP
ncbi:MAG: ExbD/TolR family protein [Rhodospirillaceae bacterium]